MINHQPVIKANELTKIFGSFRAVDAISFEVQKGEIFGFLGANGSGKTTAMRMLCGLIRPTSGKATVAGYDVFEEPEKIKQSIGYMSQRFSLYEDLTVKENMRLFGGIYGMKTKAIKQKSEQIIEQLHLQDNQHSLVGSLPLGWKQKLAFSVAIFHNPGLVFLDEPTGGVDPSTRREFWEMIYDAAHSGTTVFVTTHYMDEAAYCNRVCVMVDGKIEALGTPANLRKDFDAPNFEEVFIHLARRASRTAD